MQSLKASVMSRNSCLGCVVIINLQHEREGADPAVRGRAAAEEVLQVSLLAEARRGGPRAAEGGLPLVPRVGAGAQRPHLRRSAHRDRRQVFQFIKDGRF